MWNIGKSRTPAELAFDRRNTNIKRIKLFGRVAFCHVKQSEDNISVRSIKGIMLRL